MHAIIEVTLFLTISPCHMITFIMGITFNRIIHARMEGHAPCSEESFMIIVEYMWAWFYCNEVCYNIMYYFLHFVHVLLVI